ncbi:TIGR00159 family protein [bacterium]|nr:TIGR00159 family protein [bacterium]
MSEILTVLGNLSGRDLIDILLVASLFYLLYTFVKGTRAVQVLQGLALILILAFVAQKFRLGTTAWILSSSWLVWVLAFIVLFQPELRRALARLGQHRLLAFFQEAMEEEVIDEIVKASNVLSSRRSGALIVIEKGVGLKPYIESGVRLDSAVTSEIISTIFMSKGALHDGALIVQEKRIAAAGCILPLTENPDVKRVYGTRHRAALGLSEETDSVIVVVSEETGAISLVQHGKMANGIDPETLKEMLTLYLVGK